MTEAAGSVVDPAYDQRALSDVVPAIAQALGAPIQDGASALVLPPARSYVMFLVDGLGYDLIARHRQHAPFIAERLDNAEAGTACVPSTTATSLTSLGTALPPGAHGVVGYTSRIPGSEKLLNALQWSKRVDPEQWQPHETAFARIQRAGVSTTVVNKPEFASSGLTRAATRGVDYVGAQSWIERALVASAASRTERSLTYLYDSELDFTGHACGVDSPQWREALSRIDGELQRLREELPSDTELLLVADHGMVDSPLDRRIDIDADPSLRDGIFLVGGEARFRHLYCRSGADVEVVARYRELLGEDALVLAREDAFARGWFGEVTASVRPRIGDVVIACLSDVSILASESFPYESTMIGMHGSLTPAEMRIPILCL